MENSVKKITGWRIFEYFIIYSILGCILETLFGFVMLGVIESRQSFLYGPFCSIYGVGAVVMIVILRYFDKNNYILFIAGYIVGSIVEYIISWVGELWLGIRWWEYSNKFLNINGRICLTYSVIWGFLAIYLLKSLNPKIDMFLDWVDEKLGRRISQILIIITLVFMFVDCIYSANAENWVLIKVCVEKNLDVANKEAMVKKYEEVYSDETKKNFVDTFWSVESVLYAYPNLTKQLQDGNTVYIKKLYPEIHPYLIRIKPEKEGTIYEP